MIAVNVISVRFECAAVGFARASEYDSGVCMVGIRDHAAILSAGRLHCIRVPWVLKLASGYLGLSSAATV